MRTTNHPIPGLGRSVLRRRGQDMRSVCGSSSRSLMSLGSIDNLESRGEGRLAHSQTPNRLWSDAEPIPHSFRIGLEPVRAGVHHQSVLVTCRINTVRYIPPLAAPTRHLAITLFVGLSHHGRTHPLLAVIAWFTSRRVPSFAPAGILLGRLDVDVARVWGGLRA